MAGTLPDYVEQALAALTRAEALEKEFGPQADSETTQDVEFLLVDIATAVGQVQQIGTGMGAVELMSDFDGLMELVSVLAQEADDKASDIERLLRPKNS